VVNLLTAADNPPPDNPPPTAATTAVLVIPVRDPIAKPALYIIRRGLKEAAASKTNCVVLDMKTPGGDASVMFEIMEALQKFPGQTLTFVNDEAVSAGALIAAATDVIWFAPNAVIGAAAPVLSSGGEINPTMRRKIISYFKARVRASTEGKIHRADVVAAMMDEDFVLKVAGKTLKPKGSLLSLTATEACALHGKGPARAPLLGAGIAPDIHTLLAKKFGDAPNAIAVTRLRVTWAEIAAQYLNACAPALLALGALALIIEFKTPGFGVFGIAGAALLALVFLGHHIAGLSGREPVLVFALGLLLVIAELLLFPGTLVAALAGLLLMLGSLVWAMADLWPGQPVAFDVATFLAPVASVALGLLLAALLAALLLRFLPRGWARGRLILETALPSPSPVNDNLPGKRGVALTALMPGGQIEVDGRIYEAGVEVGSIAQGEPVVVVASSGFRLTVQRAEPK
jgi:membrane-bound serine protease (ClpP class)